MTDSGESYEEYQARLIRLAGTQQARVRKKMEDHHGNVIVDPVAVSGITNEDDTTSPIVPPTRYDPTLDLQYYPVGINADLLQVGSLGDAVVTATTRTVDIQPALGRIFEIQSIAFFSTALAAGRTATLSWYDGINTVPIWLSGAAGVASGDEYLIYPVDMSTLMTGSADLIGSPPLRLINGQYIRFANTDLAAAETFTLRYRYDTRFIGGL